MRKRIRWTGIYGDGPVLLQCALIALAPKLLVETEHALSPGSRAGRLPTRIHWEVLDIG